MWFSLIPAAIWFVGMVLSHAILGKCVLNWIALKFKSKKQVWKTKSDRYQKTAPYIGQRKAKPTTTANYETTYDDPL